MIIAWGKRNCYHHTCTHFFRMHLNFSVGWLAAARSVSGLGTLPSQFPQTGRDPFLPAKCTKASRVLPKESAAASTVAYTAYASKIQSASGSNLTCLDTHLYVLQTGCLAQEACRA